MYICVQIGGVKSLSLERSREHGAAQLIVRIGVTSVKVLSPAACVSSAAASRSDRLTAAVVGSAVRGNSVRYPQPPPHHMWYRRNTHPSVYA